VARGLLELFQIEAKTASSGREAIEMVTKEDFDLVFMDHMMPEMDGIEATAEIRKLGEKYQNLRIIALTANAIQGAKEMFLENGFDGFLPKPIEMPLLMEALIDWLPPEKVIFKSLRDEADNDKEEGDPSFWEALGKVEDINVELGLHRISGQKKMYRDNLVLFHDKLASDMEKMQAFIEGNDIRAFSISVHGIKSTLASIGATGLSVTASDLEMAAKGGDVEYCAAEFPDFKERLLSLNERLSAVFPPDEAPARREKGDRAYLMETVPKVLAAIDDLDIDTGIEALNDLAAYDFGEAINKIIAKSAKALKNYEYDVAREALNTILS
jgi:CheY-like chemotaxis protein